MAPVTAGRAEDVHSSSRNTGDLKNHSPHQTALGCFSSLRTKNRAGETMLFLMSARLSGMWDGVGHQCSCQDALDIS